MPSIRVRQRADGSQSYTAILRRKKGRALMHEETKTFSTRKAAESWAEDRLSELNDPFVHLRARNGEPNLSLWMRHHATHFVHIAKWQRNKNTPLDHLQKLPIGEVNLFKLTSSALVSHVKSRRESGAGPATVSNDLTWIQRVLSHRAAQSTECQSAAT